MLLRSKKRSHAALDRLDVEIEANRGVPDAEAARRLLELRHRAGIELEGNGAAAHPSPDFDALPAESALPEVEPGALTPGLLRAALLRSGCLLVRGLVGEKDVTRLVDGIDRAYAARDTEGEFFEEFEPDPRFDIRFDRGVIRGGAALLAVDSPRVMSDVLDVFERAGLRRLAAGYLGGRPAISINKFLLRKVTPQVFDASMGEQGKKPSAWHQDGAFMGDVQALNVWLSLSRCGDVAPGMDIVPRRLDRIVPTGTEGAVFDWSASQAVAEEAAGEAGILRPIFQPGDALLFDEMFLHSTAAEPEMQSSRYAVESWFFNPSRLPDKYAPLAF
jgi:hypothetical protein